MTLLVLALLAALVVAYIGSERRLPPPFGLAANGTIAYVNDNHVFLASADGAEPRQVTFDGGRREVWHRAPVGGFSTAARVQLQRAARTAARAQANPTTVNDK